MAKDLTQKTYDFMNEEEPKKKEVKKIKATLFQKIILGAMISVPIVVPSCAYLVNKEVERMNRGYEEMERDIKGAFIRAGIEILEDIQDNPEAYGLDSGEESYKEEPLRNSQKSYSN
ncbi:hypothetical protein J4221_05990 [Candidatus Pacearchaeota archaeon]|nr:hypothetical protein [Candidatus Pacearchaeota archaeon]